MQKIIGLDIGSYSVKAVEIVNRYKSYEISNFYENIIPHIEELSPDAVIPACMEQLFQENNLQADRIITAMPGQYISSRILPFNFSDAHKIEAAVYAEVEVAVPFNLDDMIIDHQILGQMEGKTIALVVMTRKAFLSSFLDHLQRISIDPKLVDVDSLAFYNLCPYLQMEPGKCYGLVDVGHEKTSVCMVQDGVLRMFRSINLGGRYITEFLARDLELSFNEAQRIKHSVSTVLTPKFSGDALSKEERHVADRITIASNTIVKELGRTLYAFKTWEKSPIEQIFLSGGTSVIKHFDEYLSLHLEVPVTHNAAEMHSLKINPDLMVRMPSMCQGISIGMRAVTSVKRHSQINLRKDEFAYVQDYESIFKASGVVFKAVAVALLLLTGAYAAKHFTYSAQIKKMQDEYRRDVEPVLAKKDGKSSSKSWDFGRLRKQAESELRGKINDQKASSQRFIRVNSDSGPLIALQEISQHLPKTVKVDVIEYKFETQASGNGKLKLRIEADSYQTVSKFEEALNETPSLTNIVEKAVGTKPGTGGTAGEIKDAQIEADYSGSDEN